MCRSVTVEEAENKVDPEQCRGKRNREEKEGKASGHVCCVGVWLLVVGVGLTRGGEGGTAYCDDLCYRKLF